jgi:glycolate oxidase iron-sulfur subunit
VKTDNFSLSLGIDEDSLASCVSCGLCLPHCPTYRVTQEEAASPRGRIALMRQVTESGQADASFVEFMDACIQCRGCESACPAAVPFGQMMEQTREALVEQSNYQPWWRRAGYMVLGRSRLLGMGSRVLALLQRTRLVPKKLGLPPIPLTQPRLQPSGRDVWLFTGCIMDSWMRSTHASTQKAIEAVGVTVALPSRGAACCGALHVHAGLANDARALARRTMAAMPGDAPILVNSAGCGAQLKDYGHLVGTEEAATFSSRVLDIHEWLAERVEDLPEPRGERPTVAIQDPCHLRHVQNAHLPVRVILGRYCDLVELDDDGLCCGAGGAYSTLHPDTAAAVRERKSASIDRASPSLVASANPGCMLHLRAAGHDVAHPMDILQSLWASETPLRTGDT